MGLSAAMAGGGAPKTRAEGVRLGVRRCQEHLAARCGGEGPREGAGECGGASDSFGWGVGVMNVSNVLCFRGDGAGVAENCSSPGVFASTPGLVGFTRASSMTRSASSTRLRRPRCWAQAAPLWGRRVTMPAPRSATMESQW